MIKKILIGVEDSKYAEAAAKYGFSLAKSLNAHVGLVNMIEPVAIPSITNTGASEILGMPMTGLSGADDVEFYKLQDQISENILQSISDKFSGKLEITHFSQYGSTRDGIIECSKEFKADIIVIGTHHRSGLDRLFSSSIAEYVMHHSEIPVLIVPTKE
jgi:nucleotide-binding universal stress UspA family protein